jgi:DnaJ-class molecular chaperone
VPQDPNIHPYWAAETKELERRIDQLDYFEVLGVSVDAPFDDIKSMYHALQRAYHPDTFYQSPDAELRNAVFHISKRVAEAYVILRDPEKRQKYTRDLQGPERDKKLRFTEDSESEAKREKDTELGKTPQVRNLVIKALAAMRKSDFTSAERDLKTAVLFEKDNEQINNKLQEVQAELKARQPKGASGPAAAAKKPSNPPGPEKK